MLTMVDDISENPVLASLYQEMKCGIFTNPDGEVLIVHDQPVQSPIEWIEYDQNTQQFLLVHKHGYIQELGIELDQNMLSNLSQGQEITLAHIVDKKIKALQTVVFLFKSIEV